MLLLVSTRRVVLGTTAIDRFAHARPMVAATSRQGFTAAQQQSLLACTKTAPYCTRTAAVLSSCTSTTNIFDRRYSRTRADRTLLNGMCHVRANRTLLKNVIPPPPPPAGASPMHDKDRRPNDDDEDDGDDAHPHDKRAGRRIA